MFGAGAHRMGASAQGMWAGLPNSGQVTMLLSRAVGLFLVSVCAGKTNETPRAYKTKLDKLISVLGDVPIETIRASDLEQFRQYLLTQPVKRRGNAWINEPLSVWYIRGVLRVTKQFFRWCAENEHLPGDPAYRLKLPKAPQTLPKAIDSGVFAKLLEAASSSGDTWARVRNVAFLCLLRDTGARVSGLLNAMVSDVDLASGVILVTEKGKARPVFFCAASRSALGRWLDVRAVLPVACDNLFVGRSGCRLSRSGVYQLLDRLGDVAGVVGARFNPHSFRHAFARDVLRAGADLSEASQMMGHSGLAVTGDYYARWLPSELQAVHRRTSPGASLPDVLKDV